MIDLTGDSPAGIERWGPTQLSNCNIYFSLHTSKKFYVKSGPQFYLIVGSGAI